MSVLSPFLSSLLFSPPFRLFNKVIRHLHLSKKTPVQVSRFRASPILNPSRPALSSPPSHLILHAQFQLPKAPSRTSLWTCITRWHARHVTSGSPSRADFLFCSQSLSLAAVTIVPPTGDPFSFHPASIPNLFLYFPFLPLVMFGPFCSSSDVSFIPSTPSISIV